MHYGLILWVLVLSVGAAATTSEHRDALGYLELGPTYNAPKHTPVTNFLRLKAIEADFENEDPAPDQDAVAGCTRNTVFAKAENAPRLWTLGDKAHFAVAAVQRTRAPPV